MTSKLKITAIRPYPVWVGTRNQMLVKVETDSGIFGWGESGLSGREKAVAGAIEHYREFLIGRDPMQIGRIWQEVYRSQYFEGGGFCRRRCPPSTLPFTTSRARRWGCRPKTCWAANSATAFPPSPRPATRPRAMRP